MADEKTAFVIHLELEMSFFDPCGFIFLSQLSKKLDSLTLCPSWIETISFQEEEVLKLFHLSKQFITEQKNVLQRAWSVNFSFILREKGFFETHRVMERSVKLRNNI